MLNEDELRDALLLVFANKQVRSYIFELSYGLDSWLIDFHRLNLLPLLLDSRL